MQRPPAPPTLYRPQKSLPRKPSRADVEAFLLNGMFGYHTHQLWKRKVEEQSFFAGIEDYFATF